MDKDIRIELKLRNNLILTRMEEMGYTSVADFCRKTGLTNQSVVGGLINMKTSPLRKGSDPRELAWTKPAMDIATALASEPEEVFSEILRRARVDRKTKLHMEVSFSDLRQLAKSRMPRELTTGSPEDALIAREFEAALDKALSTLPSREEKVLRYRYGLEDGEEHTLKDTGLVIGGVKQERARQLENRAFRKMRHPSRARPVRDAAVGAGFLKRR